MYEEITAFLGGWPGFVLGGGTLGGSGPISTYPILLAHCRWPLHASVEAWCPILATHAWPCAIGHHPFL